MVLMELKCTAGRENYNVISPQFEGQNALVDHITTSIYLSFNLGNSLYHLMKDEVYFINTAL